MNRYYTFIKPIIRFLLGFFLCLLGFFILKIFGSFSNICAFFLGILILFTGIMGIFEMRVLSKKINFYCCLKSTFKALSSNKENKNIKKNSTKIYVISLERAKERWDFMQQELKNLSLPYEKIQAVDGTQLSEKDLKNVDKKTYKSFFKHEPELGTIGCYLSHKNVWQKFLDSEDEFAIVLEDDVEFDQKLLEKVVSELIKKKRLWDIVSFELNHHGLPIKIKKIDNNYLCSYLTNVKHSGAYIINRGAAKKFLSKIFPIKMPIDHYFTRAWEFGVNFLGVEPRIVKQVFKKSEIKATIFKNKEELLPSEHMSNVCYNIYLAIDNFFESLSYIIATKFRNKIMK